jgi:hypothetical protein
MNMKIRTAMHNILLTVLWCAIGLAVVLLLFEIRFVLNGIPSLTGIGPGTTRRRSRTCPRWFLPSTGARTCPLRRR